MPIVAQYPEVVAVACLELRLLVVVVVAAVAVVVALVLVVVFVLTMAVVSAVSAIFHFQVSKGVMERVLLISVFATSRWSLCVGEKTLQPKDFLRMTSAFEKQHRCSTLSKESFF